MPNFTAGTSFTDGVTNDVTAAKLNALVADAVPTSSLSLNSTTGTISLFSSGTGTAATPAIQPAGDTNTGIFFPATSTIAFSGGGVESVRIDSNGRVGIGGTPSTLLHIQATSPLLRIQAASGNSGALDFYRTASVNSGQIACESTNALVFSTNTQTNSGLTERVRIDQNGNVGIGTASPTATLDISGSLNSTTGTITTLNSTSGTIATLNSTAGTIATLNSTSGTIATLNSTTGTIANLNSTSGTIATLNSTTGTIANLNSTSGTIPTLVATTLITTGTGTAATPAIVPTGDTNTGVFFPAADTIAFAEGGAEAMRIDSSGNVGIGTNNPSVASGFGLVLNGGASQTRMAFKNTYTGDTSTDGVQFALVAASSQFLFQNRESDGIFAFETNSAERLRIDASGNCSIGTATALSRLHVHGDLTLSNATTAVTASTSTITPPATVAGYLTVSINGTSRKIPYYAT
jgi:hypothetical protein